ncbi:MAG: hypothetical protein IT238_00460 [Bacteroidia bacterium]|nr:hypothetical protein [Bacteroidia bacterium]MCZ2248824.1 hypothetical protein [Bacteroidia bacterium]
MRKPIHIFTNIIFFIFLSVAFHPLKAQKMFYPGYVVTNNGDTVRGKIPYDIGNNNNYHIVDLRDDKGYSHKFNVWQIKMYSFNNEEYYTKKCERGETIHRKGLVFMHKAQEGKVTLYEYEYVRKIGAARSYEEGGIASEGDKDFYYETKEGELVYFPRLTYKKVLRELVSSYDDCLKIMSDKDFEYKKIPEVVKCYNEQN